MDYNKIVDIEKESLIQIKIDAYKWKSLYKCKFCKTFWEERTIEDRFGGVPQLIKIDTDYVKKEWKIDTSEF
jgi:hypothetical protein